MYRTWDRIEPDRQAELRTQAAGFLYHLDQYGTDL